MNEEEDTIKIQFDYEKDNPCYGCKHAMRRPEKEREKTWPWNWYVCTKPMDERCDEISEKLDTFIRNVKYCLFYLRHHERLQKQMNAAEVITESFNKLIAEVERADELRIKKWCEPIKGIECYFEGCNTKRKEAEKSASEGV